MGEEGGMKQPGSQYLKTMVETGSPVCTIIALYEKCLFHLGSVRESLANGDVSFKAESLRQAMDILLYLDNALGGAEPEVAQPLHGSYQVILAQLSLVNSADSLEALDLSEKWLAALLEAWQRSESGLGNQGQTEPGS